MEQVGGEVFVDTTIQAHEPSSGIQSCLKKQLSLLRVRGGKGHERPNGKSGYDWLASVQSALGGKVEVADAEEFNVHADAASGSIMLVNIDYGKIGRPGREEDG